MEWLPSAIRLNGPPDKQGYDGIPSFNKRGEVKHSAVGTWAGMQNVLANHAVNSWHFSVLKDGRIFQHYPLTACCYHGNDSDMDGGVRANIDLIGIEHEGGPPGNESEPLTQLQLVSTCMVSKWSAEQFGFTTFGRYPFQTNVWTLAEHKEVGNAPTACPSNRIPWDTVLKILKESKYTPQQRIDALARATIQVNNGWALKDVGPSIAAILQEIATEAKG